MIVPLVGFAVSEDDRVTEGEKVNMKTLIIAFRNLHSNRTEELTWMITENIYLKNATIYCGLRALKIRD
jgi:hypothetical protein